MGTMERQSELRRLGGELEEIRQGFLRIIDLAHDVINVAPMGEIDGELERLNAERKELSRRYRQVRNRMETLEAAAA